MLSLPNCPKCNSAHTYEYDNTIFCPDCAHEWVLNTQEDAGNDIIKDSNGNILNTGDDIVVIKDLKLKGKSSSIKIGTKVKNIRLIHNASDGHDIDCKIDGFGAIKLKSEFVKKV